MDIEFLRRRLDTRLLGIEGRLVYTPVVASTNTLAMKLAQERSEEGVVILADSQREGRGRLGRRWVDMYGHNILSSTTLKPLFPPYLLVMVASLAVVDAIVDVANIVARIKWPNDILLGERKVAGILIETSRDRTGQLVAVVGIGINVNGRFTPEPQETQAVQREQTKPREQAVTGVGGVGTATLATIATTLETECGHSIRRELLIAKLLQYIEISYLALQQEARDQIGSAMASPQTGVQSSRLLRERWRSQLATLGRTIQVRQGDTVIDGVAEDVDDNGELLLRRHSGERVSISWGDIGGPTG